MGKKKKSNNNSKPAPVQQIKVVKTEEITIEEKEKLIQEGQIEKDKLIQEGVEEKQSIIKKGIEELEKDKEKIQKEYIKEVVEKAKVEANEAKQKAIDEIKIQQTEIENEKKELEDGRKKIEDTRAELNEKLRLSVIDAAALEDKKQSYKTEILEEIKNNTSQIQETLKQIEKEKDTLNEELNKKERELQLCNEDKDFYQKEIDRLTEESKKVAELEYQVSSLKSNLDIVNQLYQKCKYENLEQKEALLKYGDDPLEFIKEKELIKEKNKKLEDKLALFPSLEEIESLRNISEEYEALVIEKNRIQKEKSGMENRLLDLDTYASDLENSKKFIRILELQREELQKELGRIQELYNNRKKSVFASLSKIDDEKPTANYGRVGINLQELCDNFRDYLAGRETNPLFYSKESIRTFIAGLAASRILILQGMSGTGKSSLPKAFEEYLGAVTDRISVQSSWKDRNDLLGFYNDFEKRFKETEFLKSLYYATKDSDIVHLIMLDEMNLSRIEYYFADFLSVLEEENPEKWKVNLIADDVQGEMPQQINDGSLRIGENTWFIGTANKDDSTFTITDKVYDRAIVLNFTERAKKFKPSKTVNEIKMSYSELQGLLKNAVKMNESDRKKVQDIIEDLDVQMQLLFDISFGNRISKQIDMFVPAYCKCGGTVYEAIDIIFSTKVLRKLQGYYDESTKNNLNEFLDYLKQNYENHFNITKDDIVKMTSRM